MVLLSLLVMFSSARAADQPKVEDQCLSYDSAYESAPLFVVKPGAGRHRVYLYRRKQLCPDDKPCAARQKAYLVSGDVVFAGPPDRNFRCVYYGTTKGRIVAGFIAADSLAPFVEKDGLSTDFLIGIWNYEADSIQIKAAGAGQVSGEGQATYQTAETVNEGEFSAKTPIVAGQTELVFKQSDDEYSCIVKLYRRGPYLLAADNGNCGGLNVTFNGIYTKAQTK